MMFRWLPLMIAALWVAVLIAAPAQANPGMWPEKIRVGLIPTEGGADIVERFKPLMAHLEKTLGIKVEAVSANDYSGVITAMQNGHVEFAYLGPKSYTEAATRANAQALVIERNPQGNPGYYGVIITRADSGIKTLADAKGKTFAFTDPNSTSGFLVPNILFYRDMKVRPQSYFREVKFSGSHGTSILQVVNKQVQVAATNDIDIARAIEKGAIKGDEIRIIWKSELIPGSPFAARKDMPESLKAAFTGAILMFNADKKGVKHLGNGGYRYGNDRDYDVIRYLKRLKKQLETKQK